MQPSSTDLRGTPELTLAVEATGPAERRGEPVTCGVPWPRGVLRDAGLLALRDQAGNNVPLQARTLDRWPDGSVRWVLLDWQASVHGRAAYYLGVRGENVPRPGPGVRIVTGDHEVTIETGVARFHLRKGAAELVAAASEGAEVSRVVLHVTEAWSATTGGLRPRLACQYQAQIDGLRVEEDGPLRASVRVEGELASEGMEPLAAFFAVLHFYAGSPTVRFALTIRNPRRARHPGNLWDLGDAGSVYFRDVHVRIALPGGPGAAVVECSAETGAPAERLALPLEVYQDSSGGPAWQSTNHVNRNHVVPNTFRGYRLRSGGTERTGLRATPAVSLARGGRTVAVAVPYFWQNFPRAVEAEDGGLVFRPWPEQYADVHELQGGEQKTHVFYAAFGPDRVTDVPLDWCRSPLLAHAEPQWYCSAGVVPYLTPRADDPNADYLRLVDAAVEGDDTFERKREVIDEFGWRHFGDLYGDHEAVFHQGPQPLVSHYNNQYDPVAGCAYQFLRSGDPRWWRAMDELAAHVIDIDVYHTDRDKSAYNHGLFWHTYHYVDADTATHRTYPRAAKLAGGGPSSEHNYATGLMLHHFLTGDPVSRATAVELGRWVIDRDDGNRTVFRWLDCGDTGLASASGSPLFHGPGRGPANSVNTLLDAHRLTGEAAFLAKAEQLIRRCIHPADDIARHNLLDAERHWFYTMFLQTLGRYLDYQAERGDLGRMYAYGRAVLLHYARWMAEHEYPYLEKPEILEYPTETWAAQDMRKSEVFKYAARHAAGQERARFLERSEFFFRYSTRTLAGMKTRTLTRPVVVLLSYGFMHAFFQQHPDTAAPPPARQDWDFGQPEKFVPQKARAKRRFVVLAGAGATVVVAGLAALAIFLLR